MHLPVSLSPGRVGTMRNDITDVLWSTSSSMSSSSVVQVGILPSLKINRNALLTIGLCIIGLKVTIFS